MANGYSVFAKPSDDLAMVAAASMTNQDPDYPVARLIDGNPATMAKATGLSTAVTFPVSGTLVGVTVHGTNATSGSITSNTGLSVPIVIAARDTEEQTVDPQLILGGLPGYTPPAGVTATSFAVNLSKGGSTPLWIGEIRLLTAWRLMNFLSPATPGRMRPGREKAETRLGTELEWNSRILQETFEGEHRRASDLGMLLDLEAQSAGLVKGFVYIPYTLVNKSYLVKFAESTIKWATAHGDATSLKMVLKQMSRGAPPPTT